MEARSWTDLITNGTSLPGLQLKKHLPGLVRGWGAVDRSLLPSLLHESTHHWCFMSALGSSLSALQMHAWECALLLDRCDRPLDDDTELLRLRIDDCVSCIELMLAALRPISEGLALFAEFDASSPEHSDVHAPQFELLMTLYAPRPKTANDVDRTHGNFYRLLARERVGQPMLRRKLNVLGSSLGDSDGYLLGYLFVRAAWTFAATRGLPILHDTDLWLRYVKSFFFDDSHWATLLLGPPERDENGVQSRLRSIADYLKARVRELDEVTAADIDQFASGSALDVNDPRSTFAPAGLRVDQRSTEEGNKVLESVRQDMIDFGEESNENEVGRLFSLATCNMMTSRQLLYLGSADSFVGVKAGRVRARIGEYVTFAAARPGVADGAGQGHVEMFVAAARRSPARVLAIARGKETVGCAVGDDLPMGTLTDILPVMAADRPIRDTLVQKLKDVSARVVMPSPGSFLDQVRGTIPQWRDELLVPATIRLLGVEDPKTMGDRLSQPGGFAGMLGSKDNLVALALAGLAGAYDRNPQRILKTLAEAKWPLSDVESAMAAASEKFGRPLWLEEGDASLTLF